VSKKKRSYKTYSAEFKDQAVKMVLEQKRRKAEVARELEISASMLDNWIERYEQSGSSEDRRGKAKPKDADKARIRALEKELEDLRMERDILKKAAAYFAKDLK
jgi:transposase